jgi:hypothetical protein
MWPTDSFVSVQIICGKCVHRHVAYALVRTYMNQTHTFHVRLSDHKHVVAYFKMPSREAEKTQAKPQFERSDDHTFARTLIYVYMYGSTHSRMCSNSARLIVLQSLEVNWNSDKHFRMYQNWRAEILVRRVINWATSVLSTSPAWTGMKWSGKHRFRFMKVRPIMDRITEQSCLGSGHKGPFSDACPSPAVTITWRKCYICLL